MRSEIMSAGQANVPQRKILTANQAMQPDGKGNMADEPTGTRNNYLTNMLDGYQNNNVQKKVRVRISFFITKTLTSLPFDFLM